MSEQAIPEPASFVEGEAKYAANKVVSNLIKRGTEVTKEAALKTLAVLDAEHNYTSNFSSEELDEYLDDFEGAVQEEVKKQGKIEKEAEGGEKDEQAEE